MVADLCVLPGLSGDLLPGHVALTLQLLLVLQDPHGNVVPLHPAASRLERCMQPLRATDVTHLSLIFKGKLAL